MQVYDIQTLQQKLRELGVSPNKKLGQNFLINLGACKKIVDAAIKNKPKVLVEVGPGLGALTLHFPSDVMSLLIELDREFAKYWTDQGKKTIHGDALQIDWQDLNLEGACLISNLPYQISASLVIERSIWPLGVEIMVLMFQKEVAQRILAKPKTENYGLLSVVAQSFWDIEFMFELSSKDFYPPPQVASRVLSFKRKRNSDSFSNQKFLNLIKAAFSHRRKFLLSNLSSLYKKERLVDIFLKNEISEKARAEELSPQIYSALYRDLID